MLTSIFWTLLITILYAYFGYISLLIIISGIKRLLLHAGSVNTTTTTPNVSLLIAAYNEEDLVKAKMQNSLALSYPKEKLQIIWITDGSDDNTNELLKEYTDITVLHQPQRQGKTAALNRAMEQIYTEFTVFCDANTMLHKDAITQLIAPFSNAKVGCVAGEKRILSSGTNSVAGKGEGAYWSYESKIKKLESDIYSTIAAAGELYAIRTNLYKPVPPDTIIDDFVISLNIATEKYRIMYQPEAYAEEKPSANMKEEMKRKIRIASGGIQTLFRYIHLLNVFKYGFFSFEYFSHKVLRWLIIPLSIPAILILNIFICYQQQWISSIYLLLLLIQGILYLNVFVGIIVKKHSTQLKVILYPYYMIMMNLAQIMGLIKYLGNKQSAVWEKAKREL